MVSRMLKCAVRNLDNMYGVIVIIDGQNLRYLMTLTVMLKKEI